MTWAELYQSLNIPAAQQTQPPGGIVPGTEGTPSASSPTTPPPAPAAPAPFSLAQLFPGLAGTAPTGMSNTSFGGAIPADQQAAGAMTWAQFLQARQQWEQEFNQNKYQYGNDFAEAQRRYNQDFGLAQSQDSRNFAENTRQFQTQFDEAKRRYDQEFPWLKKRDAWSIAGAAFLPNARFLTR